MAMAPILSALSVVGTVISAISAIRQGEASQTAANYNAQINQQNAALATQQASDEARQQQRETYLRLGAIRAAQGHSGGTGDTGSVLDVLADTAAQGELDRQNIIYKGQLQARGYSNTATLDTYSGNAAVSRATSTAAGDLFSGAANAGKIYQGSTLSRTG